MARAETKLSEADENWLEEALAFGGMGAWEFDFLKGHWVVTAITRQLFDLPEGAEPRREDFLAAVRPEDRAAAAKLFDQGSAGEAVQLRTRSGAVLELRGRSIDDPFGIPLRLAGVVRDVSECVRHREHLDAMRAELLRAARLNDLGAMASALAHELNQPLAAATNYLHAAERLIDRDRAQAIAAIAKAQAQFVRTKEIIQRIRGFVGHAHGEHKREEVSLICHEVAELAQPILRGGKADLFLEIADDVPGVLIDKVQIQQVLLNLIRNAVEAMDGHPIRRVTVTASRSDARVTFTVTDTGPGLAPDIAEHLFQPFHTTKDGGMGVGLTLCRKIVEGHGGQMHHEAGAGGATFRFTVPAAH